MAKITQTDLNSVLWEAADSSRGIIDGGIFKDYILTFLFYKYLSDKHKVERKQLEKNMAKIKIV